ncbi:MAG: PD-(D/E)XK nuclease family protein [Alistipes sp.]|jgi:RecB family exonuclease|uniref:PD-(D/E)XK nuclease family protein n=1 Tax=Alistipes onderdonkii TaxID=328813 RepID=UPI00189FA522|nr:PD-(D/E)XK nuclease family protein [Alistipes onderdonkii]MDR3876230.1 PD-(D/E)XK nuclease family protein [Alistipes sp.]
MKGFLEEVAADLYARYGEGLSDRAVLFPSRRARLFFVDALGRIAGRPMWQPEWVTIDDLTGEISGLHTGDRVRLITELYKVYSAYHNEPFDKFYFWGDMLLTDFDTIDKYLIDAQMLFRNISEIKEIEADISYLTPAQLRILSFWSSFGEQADLSEEKRRFLAIWKTLGPIYRRFRERLSSLGIAYNGMVQRAAADRIRGGGFVFPEPRRYVVAGFNALSECEKRLFGFLATAAETDFYWDYDSYYKDDPEQEAGMFVRSNVAQFPPRTELRHDNMQGEKQVVSVAAVSNAVQCKYAAAILAGLARRRREEDPGIAAGARPALGKETAVVLTDENLLLPLLYALPADIGRVNVTMGFPLRQSLAYTFVERLVELQNHRRCKGDGCTFYHADVAGILAHPYVAECDAALTRTMHEEIVRDRRISVDAAWLGRNELLKRIFTPAATWRELSDYMLDVVAAVARQPYEGDDARQRVEFLAVIAEQVTKLRNSLDECDIDLTAEVYTSLLRRHLQTLRIPFEGEPLEGIQIMGILETRNLDFENVIILSMNDDNFPGNHMAQASFIPYNLRAAYELPTPEHHEGVYAYYFYRLIQRAKTVHMLYCSHADDKSTGEPSRYIYQLDYESGFDVRKVEVGVDVNLAETAPIEVPKDEGVMVRLERFVDAQSPATLSPTAFFRYVACPLRFYFHSIARLEADDEISEEVDAPMFGTILHAAVQTLYARIAGEAHPGETLRAMIRTGEVAQAVEAAINQNYLQDKHATAEDYSGNLLLVKDIVIRYLRGGVMPYDAAHDAFSVSGLEEPVAYPFRFRAGGRDLEMKFAGIADRIDTLDDGALRVVDYKTGAPHLEFDGVESLFTGTGKQRLSNILQTLLYAMMLHRSRGCDVEPALYYVRNMNRPGYSPQLDDKQTGVKGARYTLYRERFEELLRAQLAELYDTSVPFRQCEDADTCKYCDFNVICKR